MNKYYNLQASAGDKGLLSTFSPLQKFKESWLKTNYPSAENMGSWESLHHQHHVLVLVLQAWKGSDGRVRKNKETKYGDIQTYLLTACWIWRIQTFLFSLEVEWNSYITGGEESIMRNIPRSWLAISRTIRFWRDSTAGLSWTTQERNNRDTAERFWVRGPFVFTDCVKSVWIDFCDKFNTDPNFNSYKCGHMFHALCLPGMRKCTSGLSPAETPGCPSSIRPVHLHTHPNTHLNVISVHMRLNTESESSKSIFNIQLQSDLVSDFIY